MRGATPLENFSYWMIKDRIPVTKTVALIFAITGFFVALFPFGELISGLLGFHVRYALTLPWTFFTYPLVGNWGDILGTVFGIYWLWFAGGSLERSWGSRTFAGFFFITAGLSALGIFIGSIIASVFPLSSLGASGLWLPLAALTVAFGMLNPEQTILFMLFIPLKMKYLAAISAAGVLVSYGRIHPIIGFCALLGCAAAFWYVRSGSRLHFGSTRPQERGKVIRIELDHAPRRRSSGPLKWYKEYKERKRLEDLFKKSGMDR